VIEQRDLGLGQLAAAAIVANARAVRCSTAMPSTSTTSILIFLPFTYPIALSACAGARPTNSTHIATSHRIPLVDIGT
jgi:hypothetical protein